MSNDALPEEWEVLREWLPEDLDGLARQRQFFRRARGLTDAERWLRLILMHVAGGLSLEQTALRARELGLAQISAVALFKRLRRGQCRLAGLCHHLLREQQKRLGPSFGPASIECGPLMPPMCESPETPARTGASIIASASRSWYAIIMN